MNARTRFTKLVIFVPVILNFTATLSAQETFSQIGVASYYSTDFHGRKTASGEQFSVWGMTAAHQSLPFNTMVKVTNLSNNKSVVVRINDAGPFKPGRILDVTRGAAAKLGMIKSGTTRVRLEVVGTADAPLETAGSGGEFFRIDVMKATLAGYAIQVASFSDLDNLLRQVDDLKAKGVTDVYVQVAEVRGQTVHRITIGGFSTRESAQDYLEKLKQQNVFGLVFQVR